ncbi:MAG: hypothetical protein P8M79_03295, partial [Alphaproteobacteria bacterium]|nr:hypothetical protein [Alphaproteobacteria bacterium]
MRILPSTAFFCAVFSGITITATADEPIEINPEILRWAEDLDAARNTPPCRVFTRITTLLGGRNPYPTIS